MLLGLHGSVVPVLGKGLAGGAATDEEGSVVAEPGPVWGVVVRMAWVIDRGHLERRFFLDLLQKVEPPVAVDLRAGLEHQVGYARYRLVDGGQLAIGGEPVGEVGFFVVGIAGVSDEAAEAESLAPLSLAPLGV